MKSNPNPNPNFLFLSNAAPAAGGGLIMTTTTMTMMCFSSCPLNFCGSESANMFASCEPSACKGVAGGRQQSIC